MTEEVLTVSTNAVALGSVPEAGNVATAQLQAQGGAVRIRFGTDPDASTGLFLGDGAVLYLTKQQAHIAKFIRDSSAESDVTVFAVYY